MIRIWYVSLIRGMRREKNERQWSTSRKVAGSISDGVTGIFHRHNPYGCTRDLGPTQPLTEMSTSKGGRCVGLTVLPPPCADCHEIWELQPYWNPEVLSRSVRGLLHLYVLWRYTTLCYDMLCQCLSLWFKPSRQHRSLALRQHGSVLLRYGNKPCLPFNP